MSRLFLKYYSSEAKELLLATKFILILFYFTTKFLFNYFSSGIKGVGGNIEVGFNLAWAWGDSWDISSKSMKIGVSGARLVWLYAL